MAGLTFSLQGSFESFNKFIKSFPELKVAMLSSIGKQGRLTLKGQFLSGQEINLRAFPKDKRGRHTISNRVFKKGNAISFSSFPVNLFENGRKKRSGKTYNQSQISLCYGYQIARFR